MLFYRATALQRGKSFPSRAWRMPLLHRDFSLAFALDFLDLTTFLRQILGKIYKQSIPILIDPLFHFSQTRQISCINRITFSGNFILVAILITSIQALVYLPVKTVSLQFPSSCIIKIGFLNTRISTHNIQNTLKQPSDFPQKSDGYIKNNCEQLQLIIILIACTVSIPFHNFY